MTASVTAREIREALDDYIEQANGNERVRRTLRGWRCRVHLAANDSTAAFTMVIADRAIATVEEGLEGEADLLIETTGREFADIFWGETNPVERYNQGAITVRGSQEDLMRLDAMTMLVFLSG
jgi:hypothetical protein